MKFNSDGYLDAGLHATTLAEIKTHFVDAFPVKSTRPKVYDGYVRHTQDLQKVSMKFNQFLDGSFVSSKDDPGDIDLLCMGDNATLNALPPSEQALLNPLFLGAGSKPAYECDAYFLASFPDTDPAYPHYRAQRKYWMGEFGFDRIDRPKGILTIDVAPEPPSASPSKVTP